MRAKLCDVILSWGFVGLGNNMWKFDLVQLDDA